MGGVVRAARGLRARRLLPGRVFARDVSGLWAAQAVTALVSAGQGILVARYLGARGYGLVALVTAYPALVYGLLDARSSEAGIRYLGEFGQDDPARALAMVRAGYCIDGSIAAATFLLVAASAPWMAGRVLDDAGTAPLLVLYAGALVLRSPTSTSGAVLASLRRFQTLSWAQALTATCRAGLVVALVRTHLTVAAAVWGLAAGLVVEGMVMAALAHRAGRAAWAGSWWSAPFGALRGRRREIARFVLYSDLASLVGSLTKQLDVVLLGALRGPTDAGYYGVARSIGSLAGYVVGPLQWAVYPRLASFAVTAPDRAIVLRRAVRRYAWRGGVPLAVLGVVGIPLVPHAIRLLAGDGYAPAAPAAQVLVLGSLVWLACFWLRPLLLTLGRVRYLAAQTTAVTAATVTAFVVVVPRWGVTGMAVVQAMAIVVTHLLGITYLARRGQPVGADPPVPAPEPPVVEPVAT